MYQQTGQSKPTAASVLSYVSGIIGTVISILMLIVFLDGVSAFYSYYAGEDIPSGVTIIFLILGLILAWMLVSSIIIAVGGSKLRSHPASHKKWGAIILVFSIINLILFAFVFGQISNWVSWLLVIAAIVGVIAGIAALAFKPSYALQPYGPQQPAYPTQYGQQPSYSQPYTQPPQPQTANTRTCIQCGRVIDMNLRFCPYCGKAQY